MAYEQLGVASADCLYVGDGGSRELSGAAAVGMQVVQLRVAAEDDEMARLLGRESWSGRAICSLAASLPLLGLHA